MDKRAAKHFDFTAAALYMGKHSVTELSITSAGLASLPANYCTVFIYFLELLFLRL